MKQEELVKFLFTKEDGEALKDEMRVLNSKVLSAVDNVATRLTNVEDELKVLTEKIVDRMQGEIDELKVKVKELEEKVA